MTVVVGRGGKEGLGGHGDGWKGYYSTQAWAVTGRLCTFPPLGISPLPPAPVPGLHPPIYTATGRKKEKAYLTEKGRKIPRAAITIPSGRLRLVVAS